MGALLFERGRHGALLTQVGRTLLNDAQRLVNSFSSFKTLSNTKRIKFVI